jgi:hypothetical protein
MSVELGRISMETKGGPSGPSFDSVSVGGKRIINVFKMD